MTFRSSRFFYLPAVKATEQNEKWKKKLYTHQTQQKNYTQILSIQYVSNRANIQTKFQWNVIRICWWSYWLGQMVAQNYFDNLLSTKINSNKKRTNSKLYNSFYFFFFFFFFYVCLYGFCFCYCIYLLLALNRNNPKTLRCTIQMLLSCFAANFFCCWSPARDNCDSTSWGKVIRRYGLVFTRFN